MVHFLLLVVSLCCVAQVDLVKTALLLIPKAAIFVSISSLSLFIFHASALYHALLFLSLIFENDLKDRVSALPV